MRAVGSALMSVALVVGMVGCASDAESPGGTSAGVATGNPGTASPIPVGEAPLRVELIDEAIAAVESARGGPQRFFEVNASPTIVNLFVAVDDATAAVPYVYAAGKLEDPEPSQPASGPTFASADVDFDETEVLAQVVDQLETSVFRLFSITALDGDTGVQYQVVVTSSQGAEFVVYVSGTGAILGTDQNLGVPGS